MTGRLRFAVHKESFIALQQPPILAQAGDAQEGAHVFAAPLHVQDSVGLAGLRSGALPDRMQIAVRRMAGLDGAGREPHVNGAVGLVDDLEGEALGVRQGKPPLVALVLAGQRQHVQVARAPAVQEKIA